MNRSAMIPALRPVILLLMLEGCGAASMPEVARFLEPDLSPSDSSERPANARPDACYGRDLTPAVVETVTEQIQEQSAEIAPDGQVLRPATYRTQTEARIVRDRRDIWFETPCPDDLTPQFIASLQRALAARGHYKGAITGEMDGPTRRAVRAFQEPEGLHSGVISIAAAKRLGLVIYRPDEG